jgi:hypothetical protein
MTFSKFEQRFLSPKHEKNEKLILWIGIVCLLLSGVTQPAVSQAVRRGAGIIEEKHLKLREN